MNRSLAIALFLSASPALAETCDHFNIATGASGTAACSVTWHDTGATIQAGQTRFDWVELGRQGQWSTGTLNGRPAMRYEIDRTRYSFSTLDLTLFLDTAQ